jgi:hypothetical protein
MPHLMLTSALLFALLAIVVIAIGACLGIAREVLADGTDDAPEDDLGHTGRSPIGLGEEFGLGLRNATHYARSPRRSFRGSGSLNARI